jgi:hypothetical protein
MVTKTCPNCLKEFKTYYHEQKRCSRSCYNVARLKPRIEGDCQECGKHFISKYPVTHWQYNNRITRRYCSTACRIKAQTKGKTRSECKNCGKIRWVYPSDIKLGRGNFCSKLCAATQWKGEKSAWWKGGLTAKADQLRKSPEYIAWRTSVFLRDNKACVWCGYKGPDIEADHIKPRYLFPELTLELSNGRTLCKDCHKETASYMNRWLTKEDYE